MYRNVSMDGNDSTSVCFMADKLTYLFSFYSRFMSTANRGQFDIMKFHGCETPEKGQKTPDRKETSRN